MHLAAGFQQAFKLALNVYRGWVSEDAVRTLRNTLRQSGLHEPARRDVAREAKSEANTDDDSETGTHAAMVVSEAEPIGGFVGMAISEPLLQIGILASVIGYMTYLEPWALVLSLGFLLPQMLFVPLMQGAINRRAAERVTTLRHSCKACMASRLTRQSAWLKKCVAAKANRTRPVMSLSLCNKSPRARTCTAARPFLYPAGRIIGESDGAVDTMRWWCARIRG